jgi:3-dehydroquinate synthase
MDGYRTNAVFYWCFVALMVWGVGSFFLFEQESHRLIAESIQSVSLSTAVWPAFLFIITVLVFDIVLPIPSSLIAVFAASTFGFATGTVLIWLGLMLGCCFGYLLGAGSKQLLCRWISEEDYIKAKAMTDKAGVGTLILMRGVPILAEASVVAAGLVRFPLKVFLLVTGLANAGLALIYAYIGSLSITNNSALTLVAGSVAVPGFAWSARYLWLFITAKLSVNDLNQANAPVKSEADSINFVNAEFSLLYRYPIYFEQDTFNINNTILCRLLKRNGELTNRQRTLVIVDSGLANANAQLLDSIHRYFQHFKQSVELLAPVQQITGGESAKQPTQIEQLYRCMHEHNIDRHCVVVAIGGGAVLDAVGYACSTFHRGIKLLRMPSTVLAQNDAGIGVKNGINLFNTKNLVGAFCPPMAVLNDAALLQSLSARDHLAGLAEAVKVAAIRNEEFFVWLEMNIEALCRFDETISQQAVVQCVQLHLAQITQAGDPFETGSARPLDYGHWCAHKLESLTQYQLRHGEAVAIGMALDAYYAVAVGLLKRSEADRLSRLLLRLGFVLWHPVLEQRDSNTDLCIVLGLEEFRQHLGGELCITLLTRIGVATEVNHIHQAQLLNALTCLKHISH